MNTRIIIVGWGRSGKDEAGRFFNDELGLPYAGSTSWAACPLMAEKLKTHPQLAWEHRHANRQFWKDTCDEFRRKDPLLLIRRAFTNPIVPTHSELDGRYLGPAVYGKVVTGIRDKVEIVAARESGLFKHIVWIDRPGTPQDPTVTFGPGDCTDYVKNDGELPRFHRNLFAWANSVRLETNPTTYATRLLLDPHLNP